MKITSNSLLEVQKQGKTLLKSGNKLNYSYEVDEFLMYLLQCSKVDLMLFEDKVLSDTEIIKFNSFIEDRLKNKPFQYIVGKCEFMGIEFFVGEGVLIPRSDTEVLVETILDINKQQNFQNGLDLCTGSGCIPISINKFTNIPMIGVDISNKALDFAIKNNKYNNCNIDFFLGDLFEVVPEKFKQNIDFIVSNPPYIETEETFKLMEEVRDYEPNLALDGGETGLDFYEKITKESVYWLKDGGFLFFEIGYNQGQSVSDILKINGFDVFDVIKDYGGNDRVVYGQKMPT